MNNYKKCNLYVMSLSALILSSATYASNVKEEKESVGFLASVQQRIFGAETKSEGESETFDSSRVSSKTDEIRKKRPERNYRTAKQPRTGISRIEELNQACEKYETASKKFEEKMKEENDKINEIESTGLTIATEVAEKISEKLGSPTLAEIIKKGLTWFSGS